MSKYRVTNEAEGEDSIRKLIKTAYSDEVVDPVFRKRLLATLIDQTDSSKEKTGSNYRYPVHR